MGLRKSGGVWSEYDSMLPKRGTDEMGSTDFWEEGEIDKIGLPYVREETKRRCEVIRGQAEYEGCDVFDLRHNSWLVTSRCLTVAGDPETGEQRKILIPYLDMINHDRGSGHVLTGRAVKGGWLRVLAGRDIKKGEQVRAGDEKIEWR